MPTRARAKIRAYVLIETSAGKTKAVKTGLTKLKTASKGIVNLEAVTGPYDFIAIVEGGTIDAIGQLVTDGIGMVDGVTRTTTCVAVSV
jgi:DNA-binding Lrp family transcriptional regulator